MDGYQWLRTVEKIGISYDANAVLHRTNCIGKDAMQSDNGTREKDRGDRMSDLISRQGAIDAICGECQGNCIPCENYPCGEIKALEQLPSADPEQQWILCSERLPKEGEEVFVYLFNRPSPYIAWVNNKRWYTNEFEVDGGDEPEAWFSLQKPYKEELWKRKKSLLVSK